MGSALGLILCVHIHIRRDDIAGPSSHPAHPLPNLNNTTGQAVINLLSGAHANVESPGVGDAIPALSRMLGSRFTDAQITAAKALVNLSNNGGVPVVDAIARRFTREIQKDRKPSTP
jgi:hypothetical protein